MIQNAIVICDHLSRCHILKLLSHALIKNVNINVLVIIMRYGLYIVRRLIHNSIPGTNVSVVEIALITSPPGGGGGVARYCFHPVFLSVCLCVCLCVCVCVCVCVRPIFWYFISRLLEEISISNLYRTLIGCDSIH